MLKDGVFSQLYDMNRVKVVNLVAGETTTDDVYANSCVRVCTDHGTVGTMAHLNIFHNFDTFARNLVKTFGVGSVVLNGGDDNSNASICLGKGLLEALRDSGFTVADLSNTKHNDIGGSFGRTAEMNSRGVTVYRKARGVTKPIFLTFPDR